jgi:hypothetical protein
LGCEALRPEFLVGEIGRDHGYLSGRHRHGGRPLRQVLGNLGALVMVGEAYVTFKPGLIDEDDTVADEGTRKFLQAFIDQFVTLAARLASHAPAARNG